MMDFGGWLLDSWSRLGMAVQEATGAVAGGGAVTAPDFPFWQHLLKVAVVLGGMLGVLVLGLYLWKRTGLLKPQGGSPLIKVLATHYLDPKKSLILVAVDKERLLLASAGEQLHLVTSLPPESPAAASETAPRPLASPPQKEGS